MWGRNGNCRVPVARETGAILSLSRCVRGILTPPRRRAFWPGGGPSCTLPDRHEAAVLAMPWATSTTSTPSGCCRCWFEKQPEGRLPRGRRRPTVCAHGAFVVTEALVCARHARRNSHCAPTTPHKIPHTRRKTSRICAQTENEKGRQHRV